MRLTLRGVGECDGWPEDLELLLLMQWLCEVERQQDAEETDPTAMAVDFAAAVGLLVEPEHLPGESAAALDDQAANLTGPDQGQVGDQELPSELPQADENKEEEVSPEVEQNRARLVRLYVLADLLLPHFWSGVGYIRRTNGGAGNTRSTGDGSDPTAMSKRSTSYSI